MRNIHILGKNAKNHRFGVELLQMLTKIDLFINFVATFSIIGEYIENVNTFK